MRRTILWSFTFCLAAMLGLYGAQSFGPSYTPPPFDIEPVGGSLSSIIQDYPTVTFDDISIAGRCVEVGPLPNAGMGGMTTVPHNAFDFDELIWIFGSISDGTNHIPVGPFVDIAPGKNFRLSFTSSDIQIDALGNLTAFTEATVCFLYVRT